MKKGQGFRGMIGALLLLAGLEGIIGAVLLPYYKPEADAAYASEKAIQGSRVLAYVQSFHHWLSAILIAAAILLLIGGLASTAYQDSSKRLWIGAAGLAGLFLLFQLTGHLLPWDRHAVRTAVVESGIAQGAPVIGNAQANLIRGASQVGPETLTRWYWLHVAGLGILCALLAALLAKKFKTAGYSKGAMFGSAAALLGVAAIYAAEWPVRLGPGATSADYGSFTAKPEWYVLPLHSLLTLFQSISPSVAFVGTMVIPAIVALLVVTMPWLGKKKSAGPLVALALVGGGAALSLYSASDVAAPAGPNISPRVGSHARQKVDLDPELVALGKKMYQDRGCASCHSVAGSDGSGGPPLDGEAAKHGDLAWQLKHLSDPKSVTPGSTMPAFGKVGPVGLKTLAEYVLSLK